MSLNTHIKYTLSCDKCGSSYLDGEKFADPNILAFYARNDGWDIYTVSGHFYTYLCPDCAEKEVQNEE